jgi:hypothetical protein
MLDLRDAQQRRDDGEGLIEAGDRAIRHRLQRLERSCVVATPLEACAHAGQQRAEVMRDVVANTGDRVDGSSSPLVARRCRKPAGRACLLCRG